MSGLTRAFRSINLVHPRVRKGTVLSKKSLTGNIQSAFKRADLARDIKNQRKAEKKYGWKGSAKKMVLHTAAHLRKKNNLKGIV